MGDINVDLPTSMTMAAFIGISWYIGVEVNLSLLLLFKRRRGLYFWSCALTSWGVILQPVFIILADYGIWTDAIPSITMIYLTWLIMVVPQGWVLYSRLHLLLREAKVLRAIRLVLIFNSVAFSIPTIVIGILATRKYLHDASPLLERSWSIPSRGTQDTQSNEQKSLLRQLIWTNILIIALDISLLGIQCANLFYVQGAFKPCVYGIKLRAEFVILNRLINNVQRRAHGDSYMRTGSGSNNSAAKGGGRQTRIWHKRPPLNPNTVEHPPLELGQWSGEHEFRLHSRGSQAPILVPSR
ncbi:hypothetical protein G7054_g4454 [Neopestalotiopsis clavispora]|nr:hypothetical protein G7054_g4454 [Neopestalotiopsis clavispora]